MKFHQICTLIGSFCWKYLKFQLKTYRRVLSHDTEEWNKIWRKGDLFFQKWQDVGEFRSKYSKVSKICTFIGLLGAKNITFELKKYRGFIFNDNEESCKIWGKTDLRFRKWHEEFGKFSPEYLKVSKIGTFTGSFCAFHNFSLVSRYSFKFTRCSLPVVKSLVTRCKICSLPVAEVTRCKNAIVTLCRSSSLQKITRCSLQNSLIAKNHSLLVAKFAYYSL